MTDISGILASDCRLTKASSMIAFAIRSQFTYLIYMNLPVCMMNEMLSEMVNRCSYEEKRSANDPPEQQTRRNTAHHQDSIASIENFRIYCIIEAI
jgi:hypothetical protein